MSTSSRLIAVHPLTESLRRSKASFTTRHVPPDAMRTLVSGRLRPRSGDLVVATVVRLGQHKRLELTNGRRANMHVGEQIIVAYADRYAPDQFESHVPHNLDPVQLVASGGIASKMLTRHANMRSATDIAPLGLVGDESGRPLNVADFALRPVTPTSSRPSTLAVIGTSMNSGKTTTIHYLVHGLSRAGLKPGATKVTGTGSGGDYWVMVDAGAHRMLDFTDVGIASTYRQPMDVLELAFTQLLDHLTDSGTDINLVEVADGVYQQETYRLIDSPVFHENIDGIIFAAAEAMGAVAGVSYLRSIGHNVVAVSGKLTASPLAIREASVATGLPVLSIADLMAPQELVLLPGLGALLPSLEPKPGEAPADDLAPAPAVPPLVVADYDGGFRPVDDARSFIDLREEVQTL